MEDNDYPTVRETQESEQAWRVFQRGGWLRSPERQTKYDCPTCDGYLTYLPQDGVYICKACLYEGEPDTQR